MPDQKTNNSIVEWIPLEIDCLLLCRTIKPFDPLEVVNAIAQDILKTGQKKTKHTIRMIPLQTTCAANMTDILATAKSEIEKALKIKKEYEQEK